MRHRWTPHIGLHQHHSTVIPDQRGSEVQGDGRLSLTFASALVIRMTFGGAELRESNKAVRRLRRDSEKAVFDASGANAAASGGTMIE